MKYFSISLGILAVSISVFASLSSEPFKYKYEITANSNHAEDLYKLYDYKEKLIDIYDEQFLLLNEKEREKKLVSDIELFNIDDTCRSYYASGTIVILVGDASGMTISGDLRKDSCDETVIRTKIILFDIFR
ncbi:MAG: hypothetical protein J1F31_05805 [Erysipelotrichales bacterium]|nr:hypothetical protein [Erysipelotrichales bacterium]